jgi:pSer/pThr/pTyr-binding forkhead associated (FHA) protein
VTDYLEVTINIFDYTGQRAKIRTDITVETLILEILKEFDDLDRKTPEAYALYLKGLDKPFEREQAISNLDLQTNDELELRYVNTSARENIGEAPQAYLEDTTSHNRFEISWQPAVIGRQSSDPSHSDLLAVDLSYHPAFHQVSRRSAQITYDDKGYYIESLNLNNPIQMCGEKTFINGKRLLKNGDQICFAGGKIILSFNLGSPEVPVTAAAAAAAQPSARLIVLQSAIPEYKGVTFNIEKEEITLGRADCDIVFTNDGRISRKHASIQYDKTTRVYHITDLGSSNGVLVRDTPIPPNTPWELKSGDLIGIGPETQLIFEMDA